MPSALVIAVLLLGAVALPFIAWSAVVLASGSAVKRGHGLLHWMFYPMLLALAVATFLSPRSFDPLDEATMALARHPAAVWTSRLVSLFLLVASSERVFSWLIARRRVPADGRGWLMLVFAAYWLTNVALPAAFGAKPAFSHEFLYCIFIGLGVLAMTPEEAGKALLVARNALLLFVLASILAMLVRPDLALDRTYAGSLIPGMTFRFAGLAPHANSMGSIAAFALLLLWARPYSSWPLRVAGWVLGGSALLATQSKTAWLAFAVGGLTLLLFRRGPALKHAFGRRSAAPAITIALSLSMLILASAAWLLMFGGGFDKLIRFLHSRQGADLLTLVGRIEIWQVAIGEWLRNPVFGYGPTTWDLPYRMAIGISYAFHAHNQLFNVLASAGTVGALGLLAYFALLAWTALRAARPSAGLSLALFLVILMRSVTEVPLSIQRYGPEQMVHFLLLIVVIAHWRPALPGSSRTAVFGGRRGGLLARRG